MVLSKKILLLDVPLTLSEMGPVFMIAVKIQDIKDFMSKLLIGHAFDAFWLSEASVTTFVTYTIEGNLHKEFFDTEENQKLQKEGRTYALFRDFCPRLKGSVLKVLSARNYIWLQFLPPDG